MADMLTWQDIKEFLTSLGSTIERIATVFNESDLIALEIWQRRLDEYTTILAAISLSNLSFASAELFGCLSDALTTLSRKISEILNAQNQEKEERHVGFHSSRGGRPAYDISKGTIEQLRETGMNWRSIAVCLGVSEQTLYRRRTQYGIDNNFTDITEEELDDQIKLTLNLTPYSGESYVRGSLKGRGINVQRWRIRESLARLDGIARAVRTRYAICRRTYNVSGPDHLWHIDSNHKLIS